MNYRKDTLNRVILSGLVLGDSDQYRVHLSDGRYATCPWCGLMSHCRRVGNHSSVKVYRCYGCGVSWQVVMSANGKRRAYIKGATTHGENP